MTGASNIIAIVLIFINNIHLMILALTSPMVITNANGYCTSIVLDTSLVYLTCNIVLELVIVFIQVLSLITIIIIASSK